MQDNDICEKLNIKGLQSVRHLIHVETGTMYAVFITNRFRKIGWVTEIGEKYYSQLAKMQLKDKDDIIDYFLAMDENAKKSIADICKNQTIL